jgi:hypothetical protein
MPIEPMTLALIAGGAILLASRKKGSTEKSQTKPPECPDGFMWNEAQRSCVPAAEGPPQLHITGDCEAVQMLPSPEAYLSGYVQRKFQAYLDAIQAVAKNENDPVAAGDNGSMNPHEMTVSLLSQSPIAFATDEFPNLGSMCTLPIGLDDQNVPPAMLQLYASILPIMDASIRYFNATNEPVLQIPA